LCPRADAGEELLEELSWVLVVEEATLGEPPPQPATTRARNSDTHPTVELAQTSPLRGVSLKATRTAE
jgi:hypothetical protein